MTGTLEQRPFGRTNESFNYFNLQEEYGCTLSQ